MTSLPLGAAALMSSLVDSVLQSGYFEQVNGHEPLSSPGHGITAAVWVQNIRALATASGLAAVSALLIFNIRIYSNVIQEPQDAIDPNLLEATSALMDSYCGAFTLGGQVRDVDIFGESGTQLNAMAGYVDQSGSVYRIMTIILPVIINDVWIEAP